MKLVYTDEAIDDLKRLREFIAVHNPPAATRIATELVGKIELLPDFPKMGTPFEMAPVPDSVRDMVFGKYVCQSPGERGLSGSGRQGESPEFRPPECVEAGNDFWQTRRRCQEIPDTDRR